MDVFPNHWTFEGPIFRGLIFLVDVFTMAPFLWTTFPSFRGRFFCGRFYRMPIIL